MSVPGSAALLMHRRAAMARPQAALPARKPCEMCDK
jgi:hypothetical protein